MINKSYLRAIYYLILLLFIITWPILWAYNKVQVRRHYSQTSRGDCDV